MGRYGTNRAGAGAAVQPNAVFCDGGMIEDGSGNHSRSSIGGTFAWVQVAGLQAPDGIPRGGVKVASGGGALPSDVWTLDRSMTNNIAEMIAMLTAIEEWPAGVEGVLYSDSLVTIQRVWGNWALRGLPDQIVGWVRNVKRSGKLDLLSPEHVAGHPAIRDLSRGRDGRGRPVSQWNVYVDEQCQEFARQYLAGLEIRGV